MGINEALQLFEIEDISIETEESLKIKFRQLTKKYHPDNLKTGNKEKFQDITKALETLKDTLAKLQQYKALNETKALYTVVIPLSKLVDLYEGNSFTIGSGTDATEINKRTMKQNNTLIISEASVYHNGETVTFDNVQKWNINDTYSVNCEIAVDSLSNSESIVIKVLNKELKLDMTYQSLKVRFTLSHNVLVDVNVSKKIRK